MLLHTLFIQANANPTVSNEIAEIGIVATLMGAAITWLIKQLSNKEKEVNKLNEYIRQNDKENLSVLSDLNKTMDKMIETNQALNEKLLESHKNNSESVKDHIDNAHKIMDIKLSTLKDSSNGSND